MSLALGKKHWSLKEIVNTEGSTPQVFRAGILEGGKDVAYFRLIPGFQELCKSKLDHLFKDRNGA